MFDRCADFESGCDDDATGSILPALNRPSFFWKPFFFRKPTMITSSFYPVHAIAFFFSLYFAKVLVTLLVLVITKMSHVVLFIYLSIIIQNIKYIMRAYSDCGSCFTTL